MRKLFFAFLCAAMLFCVSADAALVGSSVTGSLQFDGTPANLFDPVYGFIPVGYLNSAGTTVTVSSNAVEFGFDDGANLFTADFNGNQLSILDVVEGNGNNLPFTMTFTDTAFAGQTMAAVSNSFPLTYILSGNVLTVRGPGNAVTAGETFAATFNITAAPEPSPWGLLLLSGVAVPVFKKIRRIAGRQ